MRSKLLQQTLTKYLNVEQQAHWLIVFSVIHWPKNKQTNKFKDEFDKNFVLYFFPKQFLLICDNTVILNSLATIIVQ